jgi:hypothetical protein
MTESTPRPDAATFRLNSKFGLAVGLAAVAYFTFFLCVFACSDIVPRAVPFDDAFVSFRYAANLAGDHGLRYNAGEAPVEGYSNFLEIGLLAHFAKSANLPLAGVWHGLVFAALVGLLLLAVAARRGMWPALAVPFVLLLDPWFRCHAWNGLETTEYAFLVCATAFLLNRARELGTRWAARLAGIVGGLAALSRPEFPLWLAVYYLLQFLVRPSAWRATGRELGRVAAGFAVVALPYEIFRLAYFGTLVSNAAVLKFSALGGGAAAIVARGLVCFALFVTRDFLFVAMTAAGGALAAASAAGRKKQYGVFLAAGVTVAILTGADWVHMYASLRLFAPLTAIAALWLVETLAARPAAGLPKTIGALTIGVFVAATFSLLQSWQPPIPPDAHMPPRVGVRDFVQGLGTGLTPARTQAAALSSAEPHNLHRVAAAWIRERFGEDQRVASENAGAFGYFLERPFVDLEGLVDPGVAWRRVHKRPAADTVAYWQTRGIDCLAHYSVGADFDDEAVRSFADAAGFRLTALILRDGSPNADRYWIFTREPPAPDAETVCADPLACQWAVPRRNVIFASDL